MPQPMPIWERWKQDPKKAERLYIALWITMVLVNIMIVVGVVLFMVFYLRSR